MKNTMKLIIESPDRELYRGEIEKIITRSSLGEIEILHDHIPLIAFLKPAITRFTSADEKEQEIFTAKGVMKVEDNEVTLLCDAAEWEDEIDVHRAEESRKRAEMRLAEKGEGIDIDRAEYALERALLRLKIKE